MQNRLLGKLKAGAKPMGAFCSLGGTAAVEAMALGGLDYVIIDNEHGPQDIESSVAGILAAESRGITPFLRPRGHDRAAILKALDNGAQGLVVPYVRSIEEVLALVERAKYRPVGDRGFAGVRANGFGLAPFAADIRAYFRLMNEQTLLLPQCETRACLDDIEKIVALPGVDGAFVGPYDLSISLDVPGDLDSKTLLDAAQRVQKACADAGKYSFIYAGSAAKARQFFEMGYDSVAAGLDVQILANGVAGIVKAVKGEA
ncbi:MAG: host specificity protein [Candidatus Accumulibacter sp.]|jgi:4-hydroxy-2-oxoheptanedioate aldolase|nr:host specificity protein [Accumulibacter sp.]